MAVKRQNTFWPTEEASCNPVWPVLRASVCVCVRTNERRFLSNWSIYICAVWFTRDAAQECWHAVAPRRRRRRQLLTAARAEESLNALDSADLREQPAQGKKPAGRSAAAAAECTPSVCAAGLVAKHRTQRPITLSIILPCAAGSNALERDFLCFIYAPSLALCWLSVSSR